LYSIYDVFSWNFGDALTFQNVRHRLGICQKLPSWIVAAGDISAKLVFMYSTAFEAMFVGATAASFMHLYCHDSRRC
jgi:hypothetical protein